MKKLLTLLLSLIISQATLAQSTTDQVKQALNAGSAKELTKYFNKITELKINDKGANYSQIQSESILKDFFQKNPPINFDYIHKGSSPEGLKYNIGMYNAKSNTYRVVILMKEVGDKYVVDTINFNID